VPLPPDYFARDALEVAHDLIGCTLTHGPVTLRITEVEAYRHPGDTANHARMGRTPRNAPMWGPPGHAYVYLCYGLHQMLNLVTNQEGEAAAVLIRAAEVVAGEEVVRARRAPVTGPAMLTGPGKVGAALGVTTALSGSPLTGPITVGARDREYARLVGPRVGIDYASPEDRAAPWRVAMAGTRWVSVRRGLTPLTEDGPRGLAERGPRK